MSGMVVNPYSFGSAAVCDADFASVVSLLHFNGANGSTTFTDEKGITWSPNGGIQISTAQSKFGGASGDFGTGKYLVSVDSDIWWFGSNPFTIECWIRPNATAIAAASTAIITQTTGGGYGAWPVFLNNGQVVVGFSTTGTSWALVLTESASAMTADQWYHIAVTRSGTTVRIFRNGVKTAEGTVSGSLANVSGPVHIGRWQIGNLLPFFGYIDDMRVTKGVARYTADFTPPTAQFPDIAC